MLLVHTFPPARPLTTRYFLPLRISSVISPSCGDHREPVTNPPASCAMTMPACGAEGDEVPCGLTRETMNSTHADVPLPDHSDIGPTISLPRASTSRLYAPASNLPTQSCQVKTSRHLDINETNVPVKIKPSLSHHSKVQRRTSYTPQ